MLIAIFWCLLFASWIAAVLAAFCSVRAYRRRKEIDACEDDPV